MIGRSLRRREDERILRGLTRYLDDLELAGAAEVAFVRSPHAHAAINAIEPPAAADGLIAVVTAAELDGLVRPFPVQAVAGAELADEPHPVLAAGEVRYVGQPVAAVIARTRALAEDAAELVEVDYEPRPATVDARQSEHALMRWSGRGGEVEAAFGRAAHVTRLRCALPRLAATPIEPRGVLAVEHPQTGELTVWLSAQDVHRPRAQLAHILARADESLRVIVPDVGGAFGSKGVIAPEVAAVVAAAALLGIPLRWTEDRLENLLAAYQGRGIEGELELALDHDGRMLGLRARLRADLGAYLLTTTAIPPHTAALLLTGCYAIEAAEVEVVGARTHKVPTGPYRGAGRPDAAYMLERTVDQAARELGIDRFELRRRNLIRAFPHRTPLGHTLDSGDYARCLELALEHGSFSVEAATVAPGSVVGTGVALYTERAGGQWESAEVWLERSGWFVVASSAGPHGQGQETAFAQIAASRLGVDPGRIELRFGDTAAVPRGIGTFGGRSVAMAGSAVAVACDQLLDSALMLAAALRSCAVDRVRPAPGGIGLEAGGEVLAWAELAAAADQSATLPAGVERGLRTSATFSSDFVFSSGAHAAVVEIDRATGRLTVRRIVAVDDAGTVINPLLLHGQVIGGVVQGLGECLSEEVVFDDDSGENRSGHADGLHPADRGRDPTDRHRDGRQPVAAQPARRQGRRRGRHDRRRSQPSPMPSSTRSAASTSIRRYTPEKLWRALREAGR